MINYLTGDSLLEKGECYEVHSIGRYALHQGVFVSRSKVEKLNEILTVTKNRLVAEMEVENPKQVRRSYLADKILGYFFDEDRIDILYSDADSVKGVVYDDSPIDFIKKKRKEDPLLSNENEDDFVFLDLFLGKQGIVMICCEDQVIGVSWN